MKKEGILQKLTSFLLVFVMLLGVWIPTQTVFAEDLEKVDTEITEFTVTTTAGEVPPDGFTTSNALHIKISWDASSYGYNLQEGDYFNVQLPKAFFFPEDSSACNFDIKTPDGNDVVAKAVVTPGAEPEGGGVINVTFTDYVENKHNIKGSMFLNARFNKKYIKAGEVNKIAVAIGSHIFPIEINVAPINDNPLNNETVSKGSRNQLFEGHVRWEVRINHRKGDLTNVIIADELSSEDGDMTGIRYITDSFKLMEINSDPQGNTISHGQAINISDKITFTDNDTKFSYNMGDISGKQYFLSYDTTFKKSIKLHNKVILSNLDETWKTASSAVFAESGGQGSGDLISKIKIVKVDSQDHQTKLAGAEFVITNLADNSTFTLTTNADGEAISGKLIPGNYKIKETKAPDHYVLKDTEYTVTVTSDKVCLQEIENEPIKININVQKKWLGTKLEKVIIKLFGNRIFEKQIELNDNNNWEHVFENLRKYDKEGQPIQYDIDEVKIEGYEVEKKGNADSGFIITNKEIEIPPVEPEDSDEEYTRIEVEKKWEGKTPDNIAVTVELYANGEKVEGKELILNKENNWHSAFENLPKYKNDKEIIYEIKEIKVEGYTATVEKSDKIEEKTYWVMIKSPKDMETGRNYLIAVQNWTHGNHDTYYLLADAGDEKIVGLKSFSSSKAFKSIDNKGLDKELKFGDASYSEYFDFTETDYTEDNRELLWLYNGADFIGTLKNLESNNYITLKGENKNPIQYSFITSKKDGWKQNENYGYGINYSRNLHFEDGVADIMTKISCTQVWGPPTPQIKQYMNLPNGAQIGTTAIPEHAGNFKCFKKIKETSYKFTIINKKKTPPTPPDKPDKPTPDKPEVPNNPTPNIPEVPNNPTPSIPEVPNNPTPNIPEVPNKPTPDKPKTPNTSITKTLPKTGGGSNISLYAWFMLTSGTLLVIIGYKRRRCMK